MCASIVNELDIANEKLVLNIDAKSLHETLPISIDIYSSYPKLIRVFALVRKFIDQLRKCVAGNREAVGNVCSKSSSVTCVITSDEYTAAEEYLIKNVQQVSYPDVYSALQKGVKFKLPLISQLKLFIVNGIIRTGGRIDSAELSYDTKYPMLLSRNSSLTKLLARHTHEKNLHCGSNDLACCIRQRYWVPQIRVLCRSVVHESVKCLKVVGKPYSQQPFPALPEDRVLQSKPFTVTGVDYTGALSIKNTASCKAYIALFTCAVTRAVHLEVVEDNYEQEFLNAFIRFSSRRNVPSIIYSDNASNFIGAAKSLQNSNCKIN